MYDLFDQLSGSPINQHTIPHEIVRCDRPLLIMPFVGEALDICSRTTSSVLAVFDQILEVRKVPNCNISDPNADATLSGCRALASLAYLPWGVLLLISLIVRCT